MCDLQDKAKKAGARFWVSDAVFIALNAAAFALLFRPMGEFAWLFPLAVGHFFLFCNLFRIRRNFELLWAAALLANFSAWLFSGRFSWIFVLSIQLPITALLIAIEMRSDRYHGLLWRRLNPGLEGWVPGGKPESRPPRGSSAKGDPPE